MWGIILKILAIIGIVLLCLLGLFLLLIILILFAPVHYNGKFSKNDKDIKGSVTVWWLLGIIHGQFKYPDPGQPVLRIFGIKIGLSDKSEMGVAKENTNKDTNEHTEDTNETDTPENSSSDQLACDDTASDGLTSDDSASDDIPSGEDNENNDGENSDSNTNEEADSISASDKKSSSIGDKLKNLFGKIKYTIVSVYDKIKKAFQNVAFYINLLNEDSTKEVWYELKSRIYKILKSIRPRKIKGNLTIGTGSPDTTGYLYAFYSVLSSLWRMNISYIPDFENTVFDGNIEIKGSIFAYVLIYHGLRIFFNRKLRKLLKTFKSGGNKNGR